jgi:hypothetical protein
VDQRYAVKFITSEESQGRSGNPGYIDGFPVLVGRDDPSNSGAQIVSKSGFQANGANAAGICKEGSSFDAIKGLESDPILNFNVDLTYPCGLQMDLG